MKSAPQIVDEIRKRGNWASIPGARPRAEIPFIARRLQGEHPNMTATLPQAIQNDWVKTVLFDRGYLARIRGEAIKVYLAIIEACDGVPDRSVSISLNSLMRRTRLSCPTVIDALARLEDLGLVVSTTHQRGKVKTYYLVATSE